MINSSYTGLIALALLAGACSRGGTPAADDAAGSSANVAYATPAGSGAAAPATGQTASTASSSPSVKVYKDPNCGCCNKWVDHLKEHGFAVETMDMPDLSMIKQRYAIGQELQSCHTAVVGNYAIEGHVPADLIRKLLAEKPDVAGLAVPGMPVGSPGMEGATRERYDVLTFDRAGRTTVYAQR